MLAKSRLAPNGTTIENGVIYSAFNQFAVQRLPFRVKQSNDCMFFKFGDLYILNQKAIQVVELQSGASFPKVHNIRWTKLGFVLACSRSSGNGWSI